MQPSEGLSAIDPIPRYTSLISQCINAKNLKLGRQLHSLLIKTALTLNTFVTNRLMDMYSKCNSIACAEKAFIDVPVKNSHSWNTIISAYAQMGWFSKAYQLFDLMPARNVVSYNSVISSLTKHGFYRESINIFKRMQKEDSLRIDGYTVVSLVNACASLGSLRLLGQVHGAAIVNGLQFGVVLCNSLIDAYGKCGRPQWSYMVFSHMQERDIVSWTSIVVAYAQAGRLEESCKVFHQMPERNVVSWTALISGFAQNGQGEKALYLFSQMLEEGVVPSAFSYVSVLSACADLALVERGKQVHGRITRGASTADYHNAYVVNALVDMYCKCGDMRSSMTLFKRFHDKDVVTWNSMITGLAQNGQAESSLALFKCMRETRVHPNYVTFLGVLSACSHAGLVSEGFQILDRMEKDFGTVPRLDHYAILIDLLGRKNKFKEACELVERAPEGSDHVGMWGALLSACRIHGNIDLATRAAEALFELEPENSARYVMLSNVYSAAGWWDEACRVRHLMDERGLSKEAAYSWIEVRNIRHEFISKGRTHSEIEEMLHKLVDQMKDAGYIPLIPILYLPHDRVS
ncbi:unnamed protein product [Coffea canephora]|uniref:Pentacotripeptide-repeat region of PRORP domain-containing protein n=2 Tax=Coffea TaxID=13442 RepID=A0A068UHM8_COFCA|nr:unnamed protein product [Coffea canephora]